MGKIHELQSLYILSSEHNDTNIHMKHENTRYKECIIKFHGHRNTEK